MTGRAHGGDNKLVTAEPGYHVVGPQAGLEALREFLDKQVRIGRPPALAGLAAATCGPAFSTAAGLVLFGMKGRSGALGTSFRPMEASNRRFGRLGAWFRENT